MLYIIYYVHRSEFNYGTTIESLKIHVPDKVPPT